jgi:hypothetical protein
MSNLSNGNNTPKSFSTRSNITGAKWAAKCEETAFFSRAHIESGRLRVVRSSSWFKSAKFLRIKV